MCRSVLERCCRRIGADEAGNDGGGEHGESLARQVNRFDRLLASQLLDIEWVTVETANDSQITALVAC